MPKFSLECSEIYEKALFNADMGLLRWEFATDTVTFDLGLRKLYGLDDQFEKLQFSDWLRYLHADDIQHVKEYFNKIIDNKLTDRSCLIRLIVHDGDVKYICMHAYCTDEKNKKATAIIAVQRDMTEEYVMKQELKKSKEFLEKIMDAVPDPIFVKDAENRVLFGNRQLEIMLGIEKQKFIGRTDQELFPADIAGNHNEHDSQVLTTNQSIEREERIVVASGQTRDHLIKKTPLLILGENKYLVGVIRDVTEKNKADAQFRLMISLMDSSEDLFGFADSKGTIIYVNQTAKQIFGLEIDQKQAYESVSLNNKKIIYEKILAQLNKNENWRGEVAVISTEDGEEIPFLVHVFSMHSGSHPDEIIYGCSGSDLRKLKKIQNSLIAQSKMAALGEMAAEIAHEINNPLAIIQGKVQLLLERIKVGPVDTEKWTKNLEQIELNSLRIKKIINSSKAIARKAEKDPFDYVSIVKIIDEACDLSRERFEKRNLGLTVSIAEGITYKNVIQVRDSEIIQVLVNLLNNSFDAIKNQHPKGWVQLQLSESSENYQIEVTDSGAKIPQDIAEKMMDPFFTTKSTGEGTGLGLSLSKQIAESHQGQLFYDPKSSTTRFVFILAKPSEK